MPAIIARRHGTDRRRPSTVLEGESPVHVLFRLAVILLVGLAIAAGMRPAVAQKPAAPVIIVVDLRQIEREATSFRSVRDQIMAQRQSYQEQLANMESELRQANQELLRQRAIVSSEAYAQKRQELEQRAGEMQRDVQKIQRALQRARDSSLSIVRKKYLEIIGKVAVERGANLALDKNLVIYTVNGQNLDITAEVLARLNEQLPAVAVEVQVE
ncbi:MAG: OmpH family outer membrane protein [Kiloniellales bacterium]